MIHRSVVRAGLNFWTIFELCHVFAFPTVLSHSVVDISVPRRSSGSCDLRVASVAFV